jgi:hypothetical protein
MTGKLKLSHGSLDIIALTIRMQLVYKGGSSGLESKAYSVRFDGKSFGTFHPDYALYEDQDFKALGGSIVYCALLYTGKLRGGQFFLVLFQRSESVSIFERIGVVVVGHEKVEDIILFKHQALNIILKIS